ncbi:MAG TPA: DsbA family protein [Steroidobacteraceae bacterium]
MSALLSLRPARTAWACAALALLAIMACPGTTHANPDGSPPRDANVLGQESAPVTIVEFTDMQCPFCGLFSRTTFSQLRKQYIDTGKVRFISRDMPLPFHPYAIPAAVAARCAGEQGKYWEYREQIVSRQDELPASPYAGIARQLGLDTSAFEQCRASGRQEQKIRLDVESARAAGVTATPTFVLGLTLAGGGSEIIEGAEPLATFQQKIDALLQSK